MLLRTLSGLLLSPTAHSLIHGFTQPIAVYCWQVTIDLKLLGSVMIFGLHPGATCHILAGHKFAWKLHCNC